MNRRGFIGALSAGLAAVCGAKAAKAATEMRQVENPAIAAAKDGEFVRVDNPDLVRVVTYDGAYPKKVLLYKSGISPDYAVKEAVRRGLITEKTAISLLKRRG